MCPLPELTDWKSLTPAEIGILFHDYPGAWCIAGGWAIELFVGKRVREHADVDIVVARDDLATVHRYLLGWFLYEASDGKMSLWEQDTALPDGIHNIWCRRANHPWEFQLMVVDLSESEWLFRRDQRVRGPRADMIQLANGLPILAPEIQLLYKSKLPNRPRDEVDFAAARPHLSPAQRTWLASNLKLLYGDHPWLAVLREAPEPA